MNRPDRDYDNQQQRPRNYDGNAGYSQNDEHYHSARNLTDQFEQEYQRSKGRQQDHRNAYNPNRDYRQHSAYNFDKWGENRFRDRIHFQQYEPSQSRDFGDNLSYSRNRQSPHQDEYRGDQRTNGSGRNQSSNSNMQPDYYNSSGRDTAWNSGHNRGAGADKQQPYDGGQNAPYSHRSSNFYSSNERGSYSGEHRGRLYGHEGYSNASDNFGDAGAYGGRSSYNRNTSFYGDAGENDRF